METKQNNNCVSAFTYSPLSKKVEAYRGRMFCEPPISRLASVSTHPQDGMSRQDVLRAPNFQTRLGILLLRGVLQ